MELSSKAQELIIRISDKSTKLGDLRKIANSIKKDHDLVKELFDQFEKAKSRASKIKIVKQALSELKVHAAIEEEIFYPAAYEALDEDGDDLLDEAEVEHASCKALIAEIEAMSVGEPLFDA